MSEKISRADRKRRKEEKIENIVKEFSIGVAQKNVGKVTLSREQIAKEMMEFFNAIFKKCPQERTLQEQAVNVIIHRWGNPIMDYDLRKVFESNNEI